MRHTIIYDSHSSPSFLVQQTTFICTKTSSVSFEYAYCIYKYIFFSRFISDYRILNIFNLLLQRNGHQMK